MTNDIILKVCKFIYPSYGKRYDYYWNGKLQPLFIDQKLNENFKENDYIFVESFHIQYFYNDFKNIKVPFNVISRIKYDGPNVSMLKSWNVIETSNKEEFTYVTSNCLGAIFYKNLLKREYDTPFITSYIQDDWQYLKFCKNYNYYINVEPIFGVAKLPFDTYYNNDGLTNKDVLTMFLDDIEITWIHERKGKEDCLEKYKRRRERSKNKTPCFIWGDSLLHQQHSEEDRKKMIEEFKKIPNSFYMHKESRKEWIDKRFDDRCNPTGAHAHTLKWQYVDTCNEEIIKYLHENKHLI